MVSGGFRAAAGRKPDPLSGRSEKRGVSVMSLPNGGNGGRPPRYPLGSFDMGDEESSRRFRIRERAVWRALWRTPQACAWTKPEYSYMLFDIALYCRQLTICESSQATAADRGLLPRYADRIGLSASSMAALGWRIVPDEIGSRRMESEATAETEVRPRRLRG